jgi:SulP family sulfate permease
MHGFPVSSSGSRTALGDTVGSRTQLYSLVMLVAVLAVMLFGRDVLATFPTAALGALVVYAALRLVDVREFKRLARFRRSELILALATTAAVLVFGVLCSRRPRATAAGSAGSPACGLPSAASSFATLAWA